MKAEISGSKPPPRGSTGQPRPATVRSHRDLEAFQRSMELLVHVHELCDRFPVDERYDLAKQMRRASETIADSIAEGFERKSSEKLFKKHIKTAIASASEMESHLKKAGRLGFVEGEDLAKLTDGYGHIGEQLDRLIVNWKRY